MKNETELMFAKQKIGLQFFIENFAKQISTRAM